MAISGLGIAGAAAGLIFLWSATKGASPQTVLRELITGKQPSGQNIHPIDSTVQDTGSTGSTALTGTGSASASQILAVAASMKGARYVFGGGHGSNPCDPNGMDCSGYVSCVLNKVGVMHGSMDTGGLAGIGKSVPYDQRAPGDIIVWNGGTGGGHCGIIIDASNMWNNPCTGCGGVQISTYPFGSRTAASAVIRRV